MTAHYCCIMSTNDNVFTADGGNGDSVTTLPTSQRKCDNLYEGNEELWGVAPVGFVYSVETTKELSLGEVENVLLESVSAAVIDSIYNNDCSGKTPESGRRLGRSKDKRLLTSSQRRLVIQSISPGNRNQWRGECDSGANSSGNSTTDSASFSRDGNGEGLFCNQFDGSVILGYDDVGDTAYNFDSVGDTVIGRIQEDMSNGSYLDRINQDLLPFDVVVTRMAFIESNDFDSTDSGTIAPSNSLDVTAQGSELTAFSKVTIPLLTVLALLILILCWLWYSTRIKSFFKCEDSTRKERNAVQEEKDKKSLSVSDGDEAYCVPAEVAARRQSSGMTRVSSSKPPKIFHSPRKSRSHTKVSGEQLQDDPGFVNSFNVSPLETTSGLQSPCIMDDSLLSKSCRFIQSLFGEEDEEVTGLPQQCCNGQVNTARESIPTVNHNEGMSAGNSTNRSSSNRGSRCNRSFEDLLHLSNSAQLIMLDAAKSRNNSSIEVEVMDTPGIGRGRTRSLEERMNFGSGGRYVERQPSLENAHNIPIEIGTKIRTLTDEKGQLRQELEL